MNSKNQDFLKIDDIIKKAKERGVDFGSAKPRSRLRYYAKLGLIPPAERKVFGNDNQPTGAYPKYVLEILEEIDKKIKDGKSIREIAEEKKKEEEKELDEEMKKGKSEEEKSKIPSPSSIIPKHIADLLEKIDEKLGKNEHISLVEENKKESQRAEVSYEGPAITLTPTYRKKDTQEQQTQAEEAAVQKAHFKKEEKSDSFLFSLVRFVTPILLMGVFGFIFGLGFFGEDISASLLSSLSTSTRLKSDQAPRSSLTADLLAQSGGNESLTTQEISDTLKPEPYFNINVETDVNAPLNLRGGATTSPTLSFFQNGFSGTLTTSNLTEDQTYNLPNQSGTICLNSGNCQAMQGQISATGGTNGRLARFTGPNSITSASISDLYEGDPILNITEDGSVYLSSAEGDEAVTFGTEDSPLRIESNGNLSLYSDDEGNVGVGKEDPEQQLDVEGRIHATGDICTDANGGQCLSQVSSGFSFIPSGGGGGIDGSGSSGYLTRWTGSEEVGNSILYQTSNSVGIGNTNPTSTLHISGTTTMNGFQMPTNATSGYVLTAINDSGVGKWMPAQSLPSGTTSQTLYYDGAQWTSNSLLSNTGSAIGIGTTSPSSLLTVEGGLDITGTTTLNGVSYIWPSSDGSTNQVLATDGGGSLSWRDVEGTGDSDWYVSSSTMYSTPAVDYIGIGTDSPTEQLSIVGDTSITGALSIATSTLPQLVLSNGGNNLQFSIGTSTSEIQADNDLIINSLSGEVRAGDNGVVLASATGSPTVRASGEYVLRGSVPIYRYSMPAQTNSSSFRKISKTFDLNSSLSSSTPEKIDGANRNYAFLINFADTIPTGSNSNWRMYRPSTGTVPLSFDIQGQDMSNLDEGNPIMSDYFSESEIPDNDWQLEVRVPTEDDIRIFNIFLLVYDKIN